MLELVQNIKFSKYSNSFQRKLNQDSRKIREMNTMLIAADKTTNFYKVDLERYKTLLNNNITSAYKKTSKTSEINIAKEEKTIASDLELDDRIDILARRPAFITLKDHKPNFNNRPTCRLINPSKTEIGIISKKILEKINLKVKQVNHLNSWKNSEEVIYWFNNADRQRCSFICFDVCEFYPSISEQLLTESLDFASRHVVISEQDIKIIRQAKKSLLFSDDEPWCKRMGNLLFDVAMGSYDGAETCELVGLYLLSELHRFIPNINIGLYRDDGLAICRGRPRNIEKIKKQICDIFQSHSLRITIEANKTSVNFLDLTLDVTNGVYKPYMKPNNAILYVNKSSNHPPAIIKNIPESINKRLSNISSNEAIFKEAIPPYQAALEKSGFQYRLSYKPKRDTNTNNRGRSGRKRNISWFNPPYSQNVITNIGKQFFQATYQVFPSQKSATHDLK